MDLEFLYSEFKASSGISTDTRKVQPNQLFFALKGPNFNANKLAKEALEKGARLAIIDDSEFEIPQKTLLADDALTALQQLAIHHRDKLSIPIIGLTGSNGKTTTKELLKVVLEKKYNVHATSGNLNNHIGVPLTILNIDESHEIAIIEMGANHVGEIATLCKFAKPTHGLITNIGKAHIGEFGGFENIVKAKTELFDYLFVTDGVVFINTKDPVLANTSSRFTMELTYPSGDNFNIDLIEANPFVKVKMDANEPTTTNLIGAYNYQNIAAALCVGRYFKVEDNDALSAISSYIPSNNRSQLIEQGSNKIILDAYNANPSSMEEAVRNFGNLKIEMPKIVILGDMLELGDQTSLEHRNIVAITTKQDFNEILIVGPHMKSGAEAYPGVKYFPDKNSLINYLKETPIKNSFILIKGSRGMALENLLEFI